MIIWLKFPFFLIKLSGLLSISILRFLSFKIKQKPFNLINILLIIFIIVLGYFYLFRPPETQQNLQPLSELDISAEKIQQEALNVESITKKQAQEKLLQLESDLDQQLKQAPSLLSQKIYINLAILSHYAEENEKASQYLNQARFTNPNNDYFK